MHPLDIPYILNWRLEAEIETNKTVQKQLFVELDEMEKRIYNHLKNTEKQQLDVIALECEIPTYKLAGILLNMELKGVVRPLPGKQFELI